MSPLPTSRPPQKSLALAIGVLAIGAAGVFAGGSPEPRQVLFIAGEPSHGSGVHEFPAGSRLLADALNRSGLPIAATVTVGWPDQETDFAEADAIVLYGDGIDDHVAAGQGRALQERLRAGKGLVVLHFALEPAERDEDLKEALRDAIGGWFEPGWSVNPTWMPESMVLSDHPVARGVRTPRLHDEWYYHLRFREGAAIHPVLSATPSPDTLGEDGPRSGNPAVRAALARREPQILAWTHEHRSGTRGFGFTGGHFHRNWYDDDFRTLVLNGIAWTAGAAIPDDGVHSASPSDPLYATVAEAIARGDADDVRRHLHTEPTRVHGAPGARLTPLHQAILRRKPEIVDLLLEHGADVLAADASDRTPLHMAVARGDARVVDTLLRRGADPARRDRQGWTPLHHAAAKGETEIARLLLAHGTDPNVLSALGGTPLHEAAAGGSVEVARLLLAAGTDPSVRSKTGVTALDVAREYERSDVIRLLETQK